MKAFALAPPSETLSKTTSKRNRVLRNESLGSMISHNASSEER